MAQASEDRTPGGAHDNSSPTQLHKEPIHEARSAKQAPPYHDVVTVSNGRKLVASHCSREYQQQQ